MNYLAIYERLIAVSKNVQKPMVSLVQASPSRIDRRKWRPEDLVSHLIIPGGIWGSTNSPDNTTILTRHQQIVAYKLLRKIYPHSKSIADTLKSLIKARGKKKRKIPYRRCGHSPETRAKMSMSHKGKTFNEESRLKMRMAKIGKKMTPEHIANRVESRKRNGRGFSEETRMRMSVAAKNRAKRSKWSVVVK